MNSKIKIISGQWGSRQLLFQDIPGLRPTPSRIRETLFNWLQGEVVCSQCLDLYSGTGALGFEAASRGANSVLMVEKNSQACRQIKENTIKLLAKQIEVVQSDVFKFLSGDVIQHDLVFLDPPFNKGMAQQTCHWLEDRGWLLSNAKIYVEVESRLILDGMPANWNCLKGKTAGDVGYYLYERK